MSIKSGITIKDVANAAGVSIKTVSRVINREANVRPAVRLRVEQAIAALGYVPNRAARSLAGNRSFVICTIFDNPSPSYILALQRGAMRACREAGYHLSIEEIDMTGDVAAEMARILATSRLDGVILSPPVTDSAVILDALEDKGLPYVRLMPSRFDDRSPAITIDDAGAAADMARYLWGQGHRRFALVTGPESHGSSRLRTEGFLRGIREMGGADSAVRFVEGDFSFHSGLEAGARILADQEGITAIFASNDDMAAGIYAAAAEGGVRIPADISVVGYDDSAVAELVWPQLTTIRQPVADMAAEAARILINEASGGEKRAVRVPYELVIRASVARL